MGNRERDLINARLSSLAPNERLFRANSGQGWTGKSVKKNDFLIIKNPRPFHGMPEGFPDLIGWETVEITPDMIGRRVAVFLAEEVKATGSLSVAQERFRDVIERMGGIFRIIKPT
jgi:hypothetical protein